MASIELDFAYCIDNGRIPTRILDELTTGLNLTFDTNSMINIHGMPGLKFTGSQADLIALIGRYEEDLQLAVELILDIRS